MDDARRTRAARPPDTLRVLACGSVDDGKSTLLGRLLWEAGAIPEDQLEAARRATHDPSVAAAGEAVDYSLLLDGLRAEREQGITIDVAYRYLQTPRRCFIIADAPGHAQYTRNMVSGASTADLVLVVVDARRGILPQTCRHAFVASLLGVRHAVLCVNKMDLVDFDPEVFRRIRGEFAEFAARLDLPDLRAVPISALCGDNLCTRSPRMPSYQGLPLLPLLESLHVDSDRNLIDLRFPVQYVARSEEGRRVYCGRVASGVLRPGAEVLVLPSRQRTRVAELVAWGSAPAQAFPPMSVGVRLEDQLDVARGDLLVRPDNQPVPARRVEAMLTWLSEAPLEAGRELLVQHRTRTVPGRVSRLRYAIDVETLRRVPDAPTLELNGIGRAAIELRRVLFVDDYPRNRAMGGLLLVDPESGATLAAGMIVTRLADEGEAPGARERAGATEPGLVLWFTGLPAAGKTTLAEAVVAALEDRGERCVLLDGDVLRRGLCSDLGFSPADRRENLRRVAEVARLFVQSGAHAIVALVSPYRADRARARTVVGAERFLEVHVATPLEVCRDRDPKGLYRRAARGELEGLTGVSAPYEAPEAPDLRLDTSRQPTSASLPGLLELVATRRARLAGEGR